MTPNQAREIVYSRFITEWAALDPAVTFFLDNEDATAPDIDELAEDDAAGSWVRFSVREVESVQDTLGPVGARRYRRQGAAVLHIYALANRGTAKADQLVKAFRDAFEGVTVSSVYFTDSRVEEIGLEGAWWRVDALVSFWFEETK